MTWRGYRWVAAIVQALLFLGIPFIRVGGESALRFDIQTFRLYLFGQGIWMQKLFFVLLAIITFLLFIVFLTNLLGRVWCGWLCPQTIFVDIINRLGKRKGTPGWILTRTVAFTLAMVVSASLIWYFIPPEEFLSRLIGPERDSTVQWFFLIMALIVYLDVELLGRRFCRTICPYAKLQSALFDKSTLVVEFAQDRTAECLGCDRCVRVCPTGIDIRKGLQMECLACADCIDACREMTARRSIPALIGYTFGEGRIIRLKSMLLFTITLAFFLFTVYTLSAIPPYEFEVMRSKELFYTTEKGEVVNLYTLSISNMTGHEMTLALSAALPDTLTLKAPGTVTVSGGGTVFQNIALVAEGRTLPRENVIFILKDGKGYGVQRTATFFSPEGGEER